jgi:hypothetical protein
MKSTITRLKELTGLLDSSSPAYSYVKAWLIEQEGKSLPQKKSTVIKAYNERLSQVFKDKSDAK